MIRLLVLGGFLAGFLPLFAQQTWTRLPLALTGSSAEAFAFPEPDGGLSLLFRQGNTGKLVVFDPAGRKTHSLDIPSFPSDPDLILAGYSNTPEAVYVVYGKGAQGEFFKWMLPKSGPVTAPLAVARMAEISGPDAYWGSFTRDGVLFVVKLPKTGNALRICKFQPGGEFSVVEAPVRDKNFFQKAGYAFTQVGDTAALSPRQCYLPGKMYVGPDRLLLSVDDADTTRFVSVDLESGQTREFVQADQRFGRVEGQLRPGYRAASFLRGGNLYRLAMTEDSLSLQVTVLATRTILAEHGLARIDAVGLKGMSVAIMQADTLAAQTAAPADLWGIWPARSIGLTAVADGEGFIRIQGGVLNVIEKTGVSGVAMKDQADGRFFSMALDAHTWAPEAIPHLVAGARKAGPAPVKTAFILQGRPAVGFFDPYAGEYVVYFPED